MKKPMLVLSILAAFALTGCGGEQKSAPASKTPEAKPAIKIEEQQKENKHSEQREYKMGKKPGFESLKKGTGLHQFKTNKQ